MNSAEHISALERCARLAHYSKSWEFRRVLPKKILYRAVEEGVMSAEENPGIAAGDHVMTLASSRGILMQGSGVYDTAFHLAALSDILTTTLRANREPWARPADSMVGGCPWVSSAFVAASGVRLQRIVLCDHWQSDREKAERLNWFTLAETAIYQLPMTLSVVCVGQFRDNRFRGPWSMGYLHPRSRTLRIRKKSAGGFSGAWTKCWREEQDQISREDWLRTMRDDGVLDESLLTIEIEAPTGRMATEIRLLAERKLLQIKGTLKPPEMQPSSCFFPTTCQFSEACWNFRQPSVRNDFVQIQENPPSPATLSPALP